MLHDGVDIVNSTGLGLISRRCYSLEQVLVEADSNDDAHVLLELFCNFRTLSFPACMACYGTARARRKA